MFSFKVHQRMQVQILPLGAHWLVIVMQLGQEKRRAKCQGPGTQFPAPWTSVLTSRRWGLTFMASVICPETKGYHPLSHARPRLALSLCLGAQSFIPTDSQPLWVGC